MRILAFETCDKCHGDKRDPDYPEGPINMACHKCGGTGELVKKIDLEELKALLKS